MPSARPAAGHPAPTSAQRLALRERPARAPAGYQRWNRLLFAHWQVSPESIQATLPPGLHVDVHAGRAYIGVVPFFMERVRPAFLPPMPWISWFLELNVRTYVYDDAGRPGVWFYSLDCNQPVAVALARRFFHLPYEHARLRAQCTDQGVDYVCRRRTADAPEVRYAWRNDNAAHAAEAGSLEFFLVERYLLFSADRRGRLYSGQVHHAPYRIRQPDVAACSAGPVRQAGFAVPDGPCSLLAADGVDVTIFPLQPV